MTFILILPLTGIFFNAKPLFISLKIKYDVTVHALLFSIKPARKTINRALMLSEKSLTVNSFACLGYKYQQTLNSNNISTAQDSGAQFFARGPDVVQFSLVRPVLQVDQIQRHFPTHAA